MEIPIQVAVRICPQQQCTPNYMHFMPPPPIENNLSPIHYHKPLIKINDQVFPVGHILPRDCSQTAVFFNTVYPLIGSFMEGYDVSIVMYGQKGTGKTYTLFGPGFDCIFSEAEQGIIQRCIREIFAQIANYSQTRSFTLNIGWLELCGDEINDLLDGMIPINTVGETFHCLQEGMTRRTSIESHSFLSLTLEQKWIATDGLIQHRLSTFSFCDLSSGTTGHQSNDPGLVYLNQIVGDLVESTDIFKTNIDYGRTTLTTMMKDSFGGRAQTLMFLCISPNADDATETLANLKFTYQVQLIRNFVILNTFSDNNTPIHVEPTFPENEIDTFGLQFAASQWLKLLSNAEGLFKNLMNAKSVSDTDREQIEEWIFLKSECEECLSSGELNIGKLKPLVPIEETEELDDETTDDQENGGVPLNSDNDSESEVVEHPDFEGRIEGIMSDFQRKTDNLVECKYEEFKKSHPKAIFDSNENFNFGSAPGGGRRKSLQPGSNLSSIEIDMLNRVAEKAENVDNDFLDTSLEMSGLKTQKENFKNKISKIETDIESTRRQIKELEHTITLKQKLVADYIRNNDTRTTAKQRFNKKKNKLESEYEKAIKALSKAIVNNTNSSEIERLKTITSHFECRLQDLASIKHIAGENGQNLKKIQKSLQESQKQLEGLQKSLKKQMKVKENYESQLKDEKKNSTLFRGKKNNLREVAARISHLDHVLKEKSQTLEKYSESGEKESLRHEIRNLRRTRDYLIEQRCQLVKKLKKEKLLSCKEERKLLECDEAIEAIDAAIEYKNELICGQSSIDTNEKLQKEKGERMLMARLNNLSTEEMRALIYKYFQKVIDLRESSRKLEMHVLDLERERDAWEWREKVLSNAVRQARLEGERNAVLLQRQHETKLTLMLRHLADETSTNSSMTEHFMPSPHHHHNSSVAGAQDLDIYKSSSISSKHHQMRQVERNQVDLYPISPQDAQYKPLDKFKGPKERETKNKLFQKIQLLARYSHGSEKRKIHDCGVIPQENLKHLQPSSGSSSTKVTREKNKIIIQQNPGR